MQRKEEIMHIKLKEIIKNSDGYYQCNECNLDFRANRSDFQKHILIRHVKIDEIFFEK